VAIRVNPDIDARSHPHISTGLKVNKFGIPFDEATTLLGFLSRRTSLQLVAVHVHVGSQITTLEPMERAAAFIGAALQHKKERSKPAAAGASVAASHDGQHAPTSENPRTPVLRAAPHATA